MEKILLISNYAHHYRLKNYNYFSEQFKKCGYEFVLLTEGMDKVDFSINYPIIVEKQNITKYIQVIEETKPSAVIIFLHLKDIVNYPVSIYCKLKSIPSIFWNKGINIKTPNNFIKNQFYYFLHNIADAIVLYTPNEIKDIRPRNHSKVFFGYNTLSFEGLDKDKVPDLAYVKNKYGIKEDNIVLFAATIKEDKKLDALLKEPCLDKSIAVVIAGKGINEEQLTLINSYSNYYYIGTIPYDDYEMNALFKACKFFTTPGDLGLALNQALFWGKPVVALDVPHSVEIYYLVNDYNGYLAKNMKDFWSFIQDLNQDSDRYMQFSANCFESFDNKAHISNMYNGFESAVKFATKRDTK
ncbi:glycosyltransferase [Arcicella sp. DC2W]|uniref:Glycosyltransferase n=1 Tax=Arcicella gelida TaxID=2984195 RepID=A0ABU5S880_9BACT|nr:glycosyltransferase [Arcicella sp. DC2W]MEA5404561.1 glycosyltransferase [Arcicella sp. DC2W]